MTAGGPGQPHEYVPQGFRGCGHYDGDDRCGAPYASALHDVSAASAPTEDGKVVMNAIMLEDAKAGEYVQLVYTPEQGATVHRAPQPAARVSPSPAGEPHPDVVHDFRPDSHGDCKVRVSKTGGGWRYCEQRSPNHPIHLPSAGGTSGQDTGIDTAAIRARYYVSAEDNGSFQRACSDIQFLADALDDCRADLAAEREKVDFWIKTAAETRAQYAELERAEMAREAERDKLERRMDVALAGTDDLDEYTENVHTKLDRLVDLWRTSDDDLAAETASLQTTAAAWGRNVRYSEGLRAELDAANAALTRVTAVCDRFAEEHSRLGFRHAPFVEDVRAAIAGPTGDAGTPARDPNCGLVHPHTATARCGGQDAEEGSTP